MLALEVLLRRSSQGFYPGGREDCRGGRGGGDSWCLTFRAKRGWKLQTWLGPLKARSSKSAEPARPTLMLSLVRFLVVAGDHQYLAYLW